MEGQVFFQRTAQLFTRLCTHSMRMLARSSRQALAASQHPTSRRACCPQCGLPSSTTSLPSSSPRAASSTASVAPAAAARGFLASRHAGPQSAVMQGTSLRGSMTTARATSSSSSGGSDGGGGIETFDKAPPFSLHGFPPLYLRRSLEAMVGRESFKAAGVTFNERQVRTIMFMLCHHPLALSSAVSAIGVMRA